MWTREQAISVSKLMIDYRWPWRFVSDEHPYDLGLGTVVDADGRAVAERVDCNAGEWIVNLVNDTASPDQVSLALREG